MPQGPTGALTFDEAEALGIDATGRTDMPEGWGAPGLAHPLPAPTERHGAAHRILTTKKQDQSQHHQITNAPNSRQQNEEHLAWAKGIWDATTHMRPRLD